MPYLTVYTNVDFVNGEELAQSASQLTAETLHKPVSYIVVNFIYNPAMSFGGSATAKGALVELKAIGLKGKDEFVREITKFLSSKLNITDVDNINIALTDYPASQVAMAGHTFG